MLFAAARAVADLASRQDSGASLLPRVSDLRETSAVVAVAVARAAARDGVADAIPSEAVDDVVRSAMWRCDYHPVVAV
jgi:malate dehydrogenase (oxaloacetate-decarboxylating)